MGAKASTRLWVRRRDPSRNGRGCTACSVSICSPVLSISTVSLRRYLSGARRTPDDVAVRLHALALIVGDLAGAYNDVGIRLWFARPRTVLGNRAPVDVLAAGWRPNDREVRQVRGLAHALTASPAT